MKFCILSWAILFGRARLAVANEEIRVPHAHDADPRVRGMVRPTEGKRNPLTAGLRKPKTATYEMGEGEHRSLCGKGDEKRHMHSIFDDCDTQVPENQAPTVRSVPDLFITPDRRIPRRYLRPWTRYACTHEQNLQMNFATSWFLAKCLHIASVQNLHGRYASYLHVMLIQCLCFSTVLE